MSESFFQSQFLNEPGTRMRTSTNLVPDMSISQDGPEYGLAQKRTVKSVKQITPTKKTRRSLSSFLYDSSETNESRRRPSADSDLVFGESTNDSRKYLVPSQIKAQNKIQPDRNNQDQGKSGLYKYLSEQIRKLSENEQPRASDAPPSFFNKTLPQYLKAFPGEPIIFKIEIDNPDAQVVWYKDNVKLFNTPATQMYSDVGRHLLVLPRVYEEDSGLFRAIVMTPMGTSETSCRLFVEGFFLLYFFI